jgi:hypothetical protein
MLLALVTIERRLPEVGAALRPGGDHRRLSRRRPPGSVTPLPDGPRRIRGDRAARPDLLPLAPELVLSRRRSIRARARRGQPAARSEGASVRAHRGARLLEPLWPPDRGDERRRGYPLPSRPPPRSGIPARRSGASQTPRFRSTRSATLILHKVADGGASGKLDRSGRTPAKPLGRRQFAGANELSQSLRARLALDRDHPCDGTAVIGDQHLATVPDNRQVVAQLVLQLAYASRDDGYIHRQIIATSGLSHSRVKGGISANESENGLGRAAGSHQAWHRCAGLRTGVQPHLGGFVV